MLFLLSINYKKKSTAEIKGQENTGLSGVEKRLGKPDNNSVDR